MQYCPPICCVIHGTTAGASQRGFLESLKKKTFSCLLFIFVLLLPDSVLRRLAVIVVWLSHTLSCRNPPGELPPCLNARTQTHTFWWAQLILKKHSSVRCWGCPPLGSLIETPQNIYRTEWRNKSEGWYPTYTQTHTSFYSFKLVLSFEADCSEMQRKVKKKKQNLIPVEQREKRALCIYLSSMPKILQQELHISHDISSTDTARLLSNWSTAVVTR